MVYFVGAEARAFPQALKVVKYHLGPISVTNVQLIILLVSLTLMLALQFIVKQTKMGKAMRAVSVDSDAAQLMGINVNSTISFTFALGSALAGAAGVLIGLYYNSINPLMGMTPGLKAFVAAVLGGIGIIPGAAFGGFIIGLLETFSTAIGLSSYRDAVVYVVLIMILLVRPAGLLGKKCKGEGVGHEKEHKALLAWIFILALVYLILTLLIGTDILGPYYVQILMGIGIAIIMAMGTNLVLGFSGQFPLGQAGFMAVGAYATAILTKYMPTYLGFYLSMLVGVLVAGLIAVIVGFPTLRLKGDYLAIATLGVAEIIRIAIINGGELTNGAAGLTGVLQYTSWPVVYAFVVVIAIVMLNFIRSATGRQVIAVREDEIAAESMGVNTTKIKVITFALAAMTASMAGSLYVGYIGTVVPKDFTIMRSIDYLIIAVLGGLGSMTGTIVAAIVLGLLNMYLQNFSDVRMIIYSLALILVMVFRPGGLLGTREFRLSTLLSKKEKRRQLDGIT